MQNSTNPLSSPLAITPTTTKTELQEFRKSMRFNGDGLATERIFSWTPAVNPFIRRLTPKRMKPKFDSALEFWSGLYRNMMAPLTIIRVRIYFCGAYFFPPTQNPNIIVGIGFSAAEGEGRNLEKLLKVFKIGAGGFREWSDWHWAFEKILPEALIKCLASCHSSQHFKIIFTHHWRTPPPPPLPFPWSNLFQPPD